MKTQADRQLYIDWLRVGAMFLLLFYHSGRLFDADGWHIKNADLSTVINIFNRFLDIWHMPLFFFLAGASVWFALGKRSSGGFARERVLRLFVPLVFGMLIIVPPQVFAERVASGGFTSSFFAWYPSVFTTGAYPDGNLSWHHLWFLAYLFTFSLLLLPVFAYFRRADKQHLIARLAGFLEKPGAFLLPTVPLVLYNLALRRIYGYGNQNLINDWANFLFYSTVFFYGFLLVSDGRLIQAVQRHRSVTLIIAITGTLVYGIMGSGVISAPPEIERSGWILELTLRAVICWCWLLAIVGIGSRLLNASNKLLKYASGAVLPVYILHQTIIVTLGFYIIRWNAPVSTKYFLVVLATLVISLIIYELARRTTATRFLFGMKTGK